LLLTIIAGLELIALPARICAPSVPSARVRLDLYRPRRPQACADFGAMGLIADQESKSLLRLRMNRIWHAFGAIVAIILSRQAGDTLFNSLLFELCVLHPGNFQSASTAAYVLNPT
jgi:hypothetical protein